MALKGIHITSFKVYLVYVKGFKNPTFFLRFYVHVKK